MISLRTQNPVKRYLIVVGLALLMSACQTKDAAHLLSVGDACIANSGGAYVPLTSSEATYTQWNEAEKVNNRVLKTRMAYSKQAYMIENGSHVVVKGYGTASGIVLYQVIVQDGTYAGTTGWVAQAHLAKP